MGVPGSGSKLIETSRPEAREDPGGRQEWMEAAQQEEEERALGKALTKCVGARGRRALAQLGRHPNLLFHTPSSLRSPCHGLPSRFWELHILEHRGL